MNATGLSESEQTEVYAELAAEVFTPSSPLLSQVDHEPHIFPYLLSGLFDENQEIALEVRPRGCGGRSPSRSLPLFRAAQRLVTLSLFLPERGGSRNFTC